MKNPLNKRFKRELTNDIGKYIALMLFLIVTIAFVSGFDVAGDSMIHAYNEGFTKYNIEDGHFILASPITNSLLSDLSENGANVTELFYKNKDLSNEHMVRIYKNRTTVNLPDLMEGKLPDQNDEIAIDRLYAENNELEIGDTLIIDDTSFTICGLVSLSDYTALFKDNNDTMFDANKFTIALVTDKAFDNLDDVGLRYCYAYTFDEELSDSEAQDKSEDILNTLIANITGNSQDDIESEASDMASILSMLMMMTSDEDDDIEGSIEDAVTHFLGEDSEIKEFISRQDNQAINFTGDDFGSDSIFINYFLYVIIIIIAFIFAVTTKNTIEQESMVIGTLRASGYTRKELVIHYITMPVIITIIAAIVGNILGYTLMKYYVADMYYSSYSLPSYVTLWNMDAFVKTTILPAVIVFAVNLFIINKEMKRSPLTFLRGEIKNNNRKRVANLPEWKFLTRFRARIIIQNKSAYLILFCGIFLAVLLLMFGTLFSPLLIHYKESVLSSQISNYQYLLKKASDTKNASAEKFAIANLLNESDEAISIYGIEPDSAYFDDIDLPDNENQIVVSSAYRDKYGLEIGDTIRLSEEFGSNNYIFEVAGFYTYEASLSTYMSLEMFNKAFDYDEDYYNGYFSDTEITDIKYDNIASTITTDDLTVTADQLLDSLGGSFVLFQFFASILFIIVIYLLAKMIVEKNSKSISIMKILGYNDAEVNSLYNTSTAIVTVISMLLSMPLSYLVIGKIWSVMLLRFNGWLPYYVAPHVYPFIFVSGIICYLIVHILQMHKIHKIPMSDALKAIE